MNKLIYYTAETGRKEVLYTGSEANAKARLDEVIVQSNSPIRSVSASHVEFRNGDIARVVSLVPLSAIMLTREERGYCEDDIEDTIFT